jgi:hypothetical protein
MALTRTQMAALVRLNIGNRTDINTQINTFLDWSLEDISQLRNWRDMKELDNTTIRTRTGGAYYPLPARIKDILDCRLVDGASSAPLIYVPPVEFRKRWPSPDTTGNSSPEYYTRDGDYWMPYPLPDTDGLVVELFMARYPEPLEHDNSPCPLFQMEKALVASATAYCFGALKEPEQEIVWLGKMGRILRRMARVDGNPSDWTFKWAGNHVPERIERFRHIVPAIGVGETLA